MPRGTMTISHAKPASGSKPGTQSVVAEVPLTSTSPTVSIWLRKRIESGTLMHDDGQIALAARFDRLIEDVRATARAPKTSALGWFLSRKAPPPQAVKGLYIHGGVGRGKTMLMDIFFKRCPDARKRRAHFHDFMADVQDRLTAERARILARPSSNSDPIPPVADAIASESRVICFDEFTVTDIADAMILSRLFAALFQRGVILVATSNVAPHDLYRDGLNRDLFTPFIDVLEAHVDVIAIDAGQDYRAETHEAAERWLSPINAATNAAADEIFAGLARGAHAEPAVIMVMGRALPVPAAALGVARFSFDDLCRKAVAARDYLAICRAFHTLMLTGVPVLGEAERNEAKRFILLIDTIYDSRIRLFVQADGEPEALAKALGGTEGFEFARTASRLTEMRGADWPHTDHKAGAGQGVQAPARGRGAIPGD
jgi:cell division protein ZapE